MATRQVSIEILHPEAAGEIVLDVEFKCQGGSPAHMGSLSYPGHPSDPPEIEIEHIYWPYHRLRRPDEPGEGLILDHIDLPLNALPTNVSEAIEAEIVEKHDPADDYDPGV